MIVKFPFLQPFSEESEIYTFEKDKRAMKISAAILLSLFVGVNSWHSSSFSPTRTTFQRNHGNLRPLQASQSQIDTVDSTSSTETYFWSKDRTEDEIIQYCARSLFPHEEFSVARERIEVVSAELPLIVIHNFLHKDLCEEIIGVARHNGKLKRSTMGELASLKKRFWFNLRFNFIDRLLIPLSLFCMQGIVKKYQKREQVLQLGFAKHSVKYLLQYWETKLVD
jgi:hypothetical protein